MAELFDSLAGRSVLRTFVQYLIVFCNRAETASNVISGRFLRQFVPDKGVKFGDSRSNRSRDIRAAHFCDGRRTAPADGPRRFLKCDERLGVLPENCR